MLFFSISWSSAMRTIQNQSRININKRGQIHSFGRFQTKIQHLSFDFKLYHSHSFFLWTFSFYRSKYYARPIRHSKVADRGNSHNIPSWLLWQPGSQMHLTAALKPKAWSQSIKTSVDLCISYMFRQRDLLLLDTTLYFHLKLK